MTVVPPPARTRFWFWAAGRRVEPLYRPWVAEQLARPDYARRRLGPAFALQMVLIVVPQTLLALADHSRVRLIAPAVLVMIYVVAVMVVWVRPKPLREDVRRRLMAYHGVTADGTAVTPASAWSLWPANRLGKAGVAVLVVQTVVLTTGVAVAAAWVVRDRACHVLPASDLAALTAVVGRPVPPAAAGFGAPTPLVAPGTPLVAAREVNTPLPGLRYLAAYVAGPSGRLVGPAVWRILQPGSALNLSSEVGVDAWNSLARQITPNSGYGSTRPPDPHVQQAKDCAEAAR